VDATLDVYRYEWGTTEWGTLHIVMEELDTHTHTHTHTYIYIYIS